MSQGTQQESPPEIQPALTEQQKQDFDELGVIKVKGAFDRKIASEVEKELWRRFERWGIEKDVPKSWEELDEATIKKVTKGTRRVRGLESIYNDRTLETASTLAREPNLEKQTALLLLTFSRQHRYISDEVVPSSIWHSDTPSIPGEGLAGVIVLGFINHVRPRGGGTMVITGSHRLFENSTSAVSSKSAKRKLKKYPYFRELLSKQTRNRERFLEESGCVNGVDLRVVELTGEPGDAYFVNGAVMHTITRNYRPVPRMMVRGFYGATKLTTHYQELFETRLEKRKTMSET